jgi:hypothetical protein
MKMGLDVFRVWRYKGARVVIVPTHRATGFDG